MANKPKLPSFQLSFAPFSHLFYTFFKRIFKQSGLPVKFRLLHLLECTALLLASLRVVSLAIQLALGYPLSDDPIGAFIATKTHLYDRYMAACLVCFFIYAFTTNWQLFLGQTEAGSSVISWQAVANDLTVRNVEQASKCRRSTTNLALNQGKIGKFSTLGLLFDQIKSNLLQTHLDLDKFRQPRHGLIVFSFLSVDQRKKLLQLQFLANFIAQFLFYLSSIPIFIGLTVYLLLGVQATAAGTLSLSALARLLSDLTFLWIIGPVFVRNVFLIFYFIISFSLAARWHLQEAISMMVYLKGKHRSNPLQGLNIWNRLLIRNFLTEHAQICALLDATNGQFISLAIFAAFTLNAPTNIYLIYRLIYRPVKLIEFAITLFFIYAQLVWLSTVVLPLALVNGAISRTGKYLPALQLYVLRGGNNQSLKLKYESLQSTLTESRVKSGASFGPVCLITFESLYKVVILYAVYMLAFFDLLPK